MFYVLAIDLLFAVITVSSTSAVNSSSDISSCSSSLSLHLLLAACHLTNACSARHFVDKSVKENKDGMYDGLPFSILFSPKFIMVSITSHVKMVSD